MYDIGLSSSRHSIAWVAKARARVNLLGALVPYKAPRAL
jgi:hypothetical protein